MEVAGLHKHTMAYCVLQRVEQQMGGRSSVVEFQPSKLAVAGSNPVARSRANCRRHKDVNARQGGCLSRSRRSQATGAGVWLSKDVYRYSFTSIAEEESTIFLRPSHLSATNEEPLTRRAHVAQLVEHVLGKDEVTRSIRVVGSSVRMGRSSRTQRVPGRTQDQGGGYGEGEI